MPHDATLPLSLIFSVPRVRRLLKNGPICFPLGLTHGLQRRFRAGTFHRVGASPFSSVTGSRAPTAARKRQTLSSTLIMSSPSARAGQTASRTSPPLAPNAISERAASDASLSHRSRTRRRIPTPLRKHERFRPFVVSPPRLDQIKDRNLSVESQQVPPR